MSFWDSHQRLWFCQKTPLKRWRNWVLHRLWLGHGPFPAPFLGSTKEAASLTFPCREFGLFGNPGFYNLSGVNAGKDAYLLYLEIFVNVDFKYLRKSSWQVIHKSPWNLHLTSRFGIRNWRQGNRKTRKIDGRTIGSGDQSWANTTYWICTFSNNQCLLSKPMMFFLQGFLGAFLFVMGLCGWRWIAPLLLYLALSNCDSPRLELLKWWWFQASSLCPRERHQICNSSLLNLKSWCFQRSFSFLVASQGTKLLKSWGVANTRNLPFTWLFIAKACTLLAVDGSSSNNIFCFYLPIGVVCCVYQLPETTSFIEIMVNVV